MALAIAKQHCDGGFEVKKCSIIYQTTVLQVSVYFYGLQISYNGHLLSIIDINSVDQKY